MGLAPKPIIWSCGFALPGAAAKRDRESGEENGMKREREREG